MKKRKFLGFTVLFGILLTSCGFRGDKKDVVWSKWHDNGDGTHSRHDLNDITVVETDVHHFSLKETLVEPTDVTPGKATYVCDQCAAKEERTLSPTGNYVFDQEVAEPKYLYERCSEHSAIYYKSSKEGAFGNPDYLFEVSDIDEEYTELESASSDGTQYIDTGVKNDKYHTTDVNNANANKRLPTGYTRLNYLESTGTQFIDSNVNASSDIKVEVNFKYTEVTEQEEDIFGVDVSPFSFFGVTGGYFRVYCSKGYGINTMDIEKHYVMYSLNEIYFDDTFVGNGEPFSNNRSHYIFAANDDNGPNYYAHARIYDIRFYENNTLIRDYVPAVNENSVGGLYDLVNNLFYTNQGTGDFVLGYSESESRDLPSEYKQLTYIEATGCQEIDTGIYFDMENGSCEVEFQSTNITNNGMILGTLVAPNHFYFYYYQELHGLATYVCTDNTQLELGHTDLDLLKHKMTYMNKTYSIDGVQLGSTAIPLGSTTYPLYIASYGSNGYTFVGKIYSCKISQDEEHGLVRDFVPCERISDGKVGLYDVISETFFSSKTTSDFLPGEIVEQGQELPSSYKRVEYLKFNGTQIIDTGISQEAKWVFDLKWAPETGRRELFGYSGNEVDYIGVTTSGTYEPNWSTNINVPTGGRDEVVYEVKEKHITFSINGELLHSGTLQVDLPGSSFVIGGLTHPYSNIQYGNAGLYLYKAEAFIGETKILSYVPCESISGDTGVYDLVNDTFIGDYFGNQFEVGPYVKGQNNNPYILPENFKENENLEEIPEISLPEPYHQLAYVYADGRQYLKTSSPKKALIDMVVDVKRTGRIQEFGYGADEPVFLVSPYGNYLETEYKVGGKDHIVIDINNSNSTKYSFKLNDTKIFEKDLSLDTSENLSILSNGDKGGLCGKIYSLKLKRGNSVSWDLVPAKNIYTAEVGFYNLKNNTFYTSASSYPFKAGDDRNSTANGDNINLFISRFSNERILQDTSISDYKIFDSQGNVIRDFVSVIRNNDGKVGFYDIIKHEFFVNEEGHDLTYDKKIGHIFGEKKIISSPTHSTDGETECVCKICGRHVHEKIDKTSYKVTFKVPDFVRTIRIFTEIDPSKYIESLEGYTRHKDTYNYSKSDATIYFEVMLNEDTEIIVNASNGKVKKVEGNKYRVEKIVGDCIVTVKAK